MKKLTRPNANSRKRRSTRAGRVWLSALLGMLALGGTSYGIWRYSGMASSEVTKELVIEKVKRGPFDHIVLEDGEILSSSNVEVVCQVKSRGGSGVPILWVIDEGTYVKKGDKLVEMDSSALQQELKAQRIVISSAEATVIGSEAQVKQDEIARQEYLDGTYLTERKTILSEIAVAEQDLRKAELSLQSAERLAAKGSIKPLQIEAENFAVQNARNKLKSAQGRLRVLDELTKEKMLVQFDSNIEKAKAKLESDRSTLSEEKSKYAEIESQIAACTILSPADGQVVHANKSGGRNGGDFVVEAGAIARERQALIMLPDPSKMQVRSKINESRVSLVREGMPCKIIVNALGVELLGQVTKVNKYAEPGSWFSSSSVKEFATYIQIMNPTDVIRTGMTSEVRIFVEQLPDALQVPVHGVYEHKGHHFCLVRTSPTKFETKEIEIGASNDKMVTVNKGLSEGDDVVLNPRGHLEKMEFPDIVEKDDRAALAKIASTPIAPSANSGEAERPAAGGMNVDAMVASTMDKNDKDSDGTLSAEEIGQIDGRFADMIRKADQNGDGKVTREELTSSTKKMMAGRGAGGGPGGPGGGAGPGGGTAGGRPVPASAK